MLDYSKIIEVLENIMQIKSKGKKTKKDRKKLKGQYFALEDVNHFHKEGSPELNKMDEEYFKNMKSRLQKKNFSVEALQEEIKMNKNMKEHFETKEQEEQVEVIKEPAPMIEVEEQPKKESNKFHRFLHKLSELNNLENFEEDEDELETENNDESEEEYIEEYDEEEIKKHFLGERITSFFKNIKDRIFHTYSVDDFAEEYFEEAPEELEENDGYEEEYIEEYDEEEIKKHFLGERITSFFQNIKDKIFHRSRTEEILNNEEDYIEDINEEGSFEETPEKLEEIEENENKEELEEEPKHISIFQKIKSKLTLNKENQKPLIKSNEYADYYTYKHYKLCNQFINKDELTVKDLQKYEKKVNKIVDGYDKIVGEKPIIEVLDPLNNASYQIAQKNKNLINKGVIYDEQGNINIESYLNYLDKEHENHKYLEEMKNNSSNLIEVVKHQDPDRQQELKKNARKVSLFKNLKAKLAILGLSVALIASAFQLKSCTKPVEEEKTITTTMDDSKELETMTENAQVEIPEQTEEETIVEEEIEEPEVEQESIMKENIEIEINEETEALKAQRAYLESLKNQLAVSKEENQKYQEQLSIGDIVSVEKDALIAESMDDLAKNNVNSSYHKDSLYRVVQSIGMKNEEGNIVNVKDMETYEKLKEEGYEVFGVSVLNQYSKTTKDIEGRFSKDDIKLVKNLK